MVFQAAPLLKGAAPGARVWLFPTHDLTVEASRDDAIGGYLAKERLADLLGRVQQLLELEDPPA